MLVRVDVNKIIYFCSMENSYFIAAFISLVLVTMNMYERLISNVYFIYSS